jgi:hypothetical protein
MSRRAVLLGLLAASVAASAWLALQPPPQPTEDLAIVRPRPPAQPAGDHRPVGEPDRPVLRSDWPEPNAGALAAWAPIRAAQQTPAAAPAPPERPRPPAFPYQWIGQLDEGGDPRALLSGSHRSFGVRSGDVIDGRWRIEQVSGRNLQLTWVPTGERVDVAAR